MAINYKKKNQQKITKPATWEDFVCYIKIMQVIAKKGTLHFAFYDKDNNEQDILFDSTGMYMNHVKSDLKTMCTLLFENQTDFQQLMGQCAKKVIPVQEYLIITTLANLGDVTGKYGKAINMVFYDTAEKKRHGLFIRRTKDDKGNYTLKLKIDTHEKNLGEVLTFLRKHSLDFSLKAKESIKKTETDFTIQEEKKEKKPMPKLEAEEVNGRKVFDVTGFLKEADENKRKELTEEEKEEAAKAVHSVLGQSHKKGKIF